jgi:small subunit ribosomal protein S9
MAEEVYYATGKRKSSVARVWMRPGTGQFVINRRPLSEYLDRETDRMLVMEPFKLTEMMDKFDLYVNVRGGGISGQAGAIRHGISKALVEAGSDFRNPLKKAGFLTRDARIKERKKYGKPGARASYQYSKR